MNKIWYLHEMLYYLAMKKKKFLPLVTTWVDLEGIMLLEIIGIDKDKCCLISLICGIRTNKLEFLLSFRG